MTSPSKLHGVRYLLASLFVAWHVLATVEAPAPESHLAYRVYPAFLPYLKLFHLNHGWGFYSGGLWGTLRVRYRVNTAPGEHRDFPLSENASSYGVAALRYRTLFNNVGTAGVAFTSSAAKHLCRRHSDLKPTSIEFLVARQWQIPVSLFLEGKRPLAEEYFFASEVRPIPCGEFKF